MNVLLVDDNKAFRTLVEALLAPTGANILHAHDAASAAAAPTPDLAIVDWRLGTDNGLDVCRRLSGRGVPVAMLTGLDDPRDRALARSAGADAFLTKSTPPERLGRQLLDCVAGAAA